MIFVCFLNVVVFKIIITIIFTHWHSTSAWKSWECTCQHSYRLVTSAAFVSQNLDDEKLTDLVRMSMADTDLDYHDDGYIEIVLKMMGLMCDNQNTVLQVCVIQSNTATGQYSYTERQNHLILDVYIILRSYTHCQFLYKQKHS